MPHSHRVLVFTISSKKEHKSRCWLSTCTLAYWLRKVLFSPGPVAVVVLSLVKSWAWDNSITFDITQVKKKAIKSLLRLSPNVSFALSFLHFCPDFHPPSYSLTPPMKCFQVSRANFSLKSYVTRMTPLSSLSPWENTYHRNDELGFCTPPSPLRHGTSLWKRQGCSSSRLEVEIADFSLT